MFVFEGLSGYYTYIYILGFWVIIFLTFPIVQQVQGSHEGGSMHQGLCPITAHAMAYFLGGQGGAQGAVTTCGT